MADDKNKSDLGSDDEFQFAELDLEKQDEFNPELSAPVDNERFIHSSGESHMMRNVIILGMITVLGFAGYKLSEVYLTRQAKPEAALNQAGATASATTNIEDFLNSPGPAPAKPSEQANAKPESTSSSEIPVLSEKKSPTPNLPATATGPAADVMNKSMPTLNGAPPAEEKTKPTISQAKTENLPASIQSLPVQLPAMTKPKAAETTEATATAAAMPVENKMKFNKPAPMEQAPVPTQMVLPKSLENKLSSIAAQTAASQSTLQQFQSDMGSMRSSIDRLDQRVDSLSEQVQQTRMIQDKAMHERVMKTKAMTEKALSETMQSNTGSSKPMSQNTTGFAANAASCYEIISISANSAILMRTDNHKRMQVFIGGQIPVLMSRREGSCVPMGNAMMTVQGFNTETGGISLSSGQEMQASAYYVIDALVGGRAWLKTENGSTLTVDEGTILPGYGKVTDIDLEAGVVQTSSGRLIQYQVDER